MEGKKRLKDNDYMQVALDVAEQAKSNGNLPIAAVLVWAGCRQLVEHDTRYTEHNPLCTAVVNLINKAYDTLGRKTLSDAVLYTNIEPDLLSVMAMKAAGIKEVVFGAYDYKDGFLSAPMLNSEALDISAIGGVLGESCCKVLPQSMQEYVGDTDRIIRKHDEE